MAKQDKVNEKNLDTLRDQSSLLVYGMDTTLDKENNEIRNIVQQTVIDTKTKLGVRTNGKPINYFNEINLGRAFSEIFTPKKDGDENTKSQDFKKFMENNEKIDINGMLLEDQMRVVNFNNYRIIYKHIPECANALQVYKDNIMSPDDYTKLMFNISYEKSIDEDTKRIVNSRIDDINEKYRLEEKADEIIEESLLLGESYVAVLSLENELSLMLNDKATLNSGGILNEAMSAKLINSDLDYTNSPILSENLNISDSEVEILNEMIKPENNFGTDDAKKIIATMINENVVLGSKREMLFERANAELDKYNKSGIDIDSDKSKKKSSKKKDDNKPLYINGSSIRKLIPERVVELKVDDICYGYFYAEDTGNTIPQSSYLGAQTGRTVAGAMNLAQNNTIASTSSGTYTPANSAASSLGIGEQKLKVIADIFINGIAEKVDKNFIRKNKQFKDFIYELLRQDYIIRKGIKLTYFKPDEVIKFECAPVYRDIIFFAKLYLSILTNNLLIKLGRSHDKRAFYINVGADAKYEEAVNTVIRDIKTKDYAMENLNDFNTILNLTPGRFDDYFIPTINGDRPIEIDTLPGMDVDMNNDFVEYLKNSMMSGIGVPRNLIDTTSEVDFARSISAMNANFVRSVIKYQKKLTGSFTRLYQKLYENEYRYVNDQEQTDQTIDVSEIHVSFPSPATLAMSNLLDSFQAADQNAEYISSQVIPMKSDQSTEDDRLLLKSEIIKDLVPSVNWEKYEKMRDDMLKKKAEEAAKALKNPAPDPMADPYSGGF